jgi:signal transduction histidine kinase
MARHFALDGVRFDSSLLPEVQDPPAEFVAFRPNGVLDGEPPGDLYGWLKAIAGDKISVLVRQAVEAHRIAMFEARRSDGTDTIRLVVCPLRDGSGIIGVRAINNFTDAREQAFQRRKLESIGQLASGLAHELNSLLQPVITMAQLAREDHQDDTELTEAMTIIADSARRAGELVHGMLLYVRRPSRDVQSVCIEEVVASEVSALRHGLPAAARIELHTDGLKQWVLIQPGELGQIIKNLANNAIDSMGGGGTVTITVSDIRVTDTQAVSMQVPEGQRYARLAVSDHGTGIAPSLLKRIFEPFFTSKALGQGTGLGLSIVHGLVRSRGGTISARNLPAGGAEFEILLPSEDCIAKSLVP